MDTIIDNNAYKNTFAQDVRGPCKVKTTGRRNVVLRFVIDTTIVDHVYG